ncbi:hypothetical protein [Mycolicibacterium fortuitum]|uniref:hypothetical protein n=1 Tax=Mycolicibacterium fortuitum TaxID=1766 RepID=UPI000AED7FF8|nr:hypothetical protein [Mycolicibacterium fortuitum]
MAETSPAPAQLKMAADILQAANESESIAPNSPWTPDQLRVRADHLSEMQRERELLADRLAIEMHDAWQGFARRTAGAPFGTMPQGAREAYLGVADALVSAGWKKVAR